MTSAAAIVADVRRAIELLAERNDPAGTRIATALDRWIRGQAFDQALDLPTDWRVRVRIAARDAALRSLMTLHPELDDKALAEHIVAGVRRVTRIAARPDGEGGHFQDLAHLDLPGVSRLRRVLAELRGYQGACNSHNQSSPSARNRRTHGSKKRLRA
jgi:hypothetical protein